MLIFKLHLYIMCFSIYFDNKLSMVKSIVFVFSILMFFVFNSTAQTTEIKGAQCNTTISSGGSNIYAKSVSGANKYRFIIMHTIGGVPTQDTVIRNNNLLRLTWIPCASYNKTFNIAVSWSNDGGVTYSPHGDTCGITTPSIPVTKLGNSYCDLTIASTGTNIYAKTVALSDEYKFSIYDSSGVFIDLMQATRP